MTDASHGLHMPESQNDSDREGGIGIASDVVKVVGVDAAAPSSLKSNNVMWYVGDPFRG